MEYKKGKAGGKKRGEPHLGRRGRGDCVGLWADGGGGGCLGPVWELAALPGLGGVRVLDGPSGEPNLGPGGRVAAPRRGGRAAQWVGAAQVDALRSGSGRRRWTRCCSSGKAPKHQTLIPSGGREEMAREELGKQKRTSF